MQEQKYILIVDDDPLIARMYENALKTAGFEVDVAFNGEEALGRIKQKEPSLIFLDVMMPKLNGVETLKILKGDKKTKKIPVIILTNLGDRDEDIQNAKNLGALDYFVKSQISLKDLIAATKKIISE